MKVCAHINTYPFSNAHGRYDSMTEAVESFRNDLRLMGIDKGDGEHFVMDLYPQCSDCTWNMCFHDYPMARYQLGPRGGMQRVTV